MIGHCRIIDSSQNGLPLEWQVVIAPPLCGNVLDQIGTLSQVGTSSYMAYAM